MSATDVESLFAQVVAAADPMMMRHYAQLAASLRLGRNQFVAAAAAATASPAAFGRRNLTSVAKTTTATNPEALPRYPVPPLAATLSKYLQSVQPLLSSAEFARTEKVVADFGRANGEGDQLHRLLQKRAGSAENWLADWWLKYAYLGYRAPVVCNSNPGLYYDVRQFAGADEWLSHAARTVWATMQFKEQIDGGRVAPDRMGKLPLDMSQYGRIFGTCRVPARDFDGIEFHPRSDYVVVAYRNGFHKLPVYDAAGSLLTEPQLFSLLHDIIANPGTNNPPIGALTAQHRDQLAIAYELLLRNNSAAVQTIQRSLFLVCLDQAVALTPNDAQTRFNVCSHQLIHGGGGSLNSANRWFDKTLQLIVNENGLIGLNYEHSPAEGQPIAVLSDAIIKHTAENRGALRAAKVGGGVAVSRLSFGVDGELQKHLDEALQHVDGLAGNLDMHVLDYTAYGKNFIKAQKMSPDSYIQMAMQYAFYKKHGCPGAHYETAQQRMFINGRTETIRSCSAQSVAFARAMCSPQSADAERVAALRAAVQAHKDYTVMAMRGEGVDRLLMGLRLVARESQLPVPEFFADESFVRSTHYRISTSQVASPNRAFMCYGPATEDGYGICYNPRDDDMLLAVSAFVACPETSARAMAGELAEALGEMYGLLVRAGGQKPTSKL